MRHAPWLVVAVVLVFVGKAWGSSQVDTVVRTQVDTVESGEYRAIAESYRIESEGLRARLEAVENRPPERIIRTDTVIQPPDTVLRFVTVNSRGRLAFELLLRRDSLYAPEIHAGVDVSDCDEGYAVQDGQVVCDQARGGHLYAVVGAGVRYANSGIEWEPSYRSLWTFRAGYLFPYEGRPRWTVQASRRVQLW